MRNGEALNRTGGQAPGAEKLLRLLKRQAERYTGGDSTSIPVETARELLESVCFCLETGPDGALPEGDLEAAFQAGLDRVEGKIAWGRALWEAVKDHMPPVESRSMDDTVAGISTFWARYDYRLFAHLIPCDIDYQLAIPVSEQLRGVDYVNAYLTHLWVENHFLRCFSGQREKALLEGYCTDYRTLLVNLFEPVFAAALGLELLGRDPAELNRTPADREELTALFRELPRRRMEELLEQGADRLAQRLELAGQKSREYLRECGRSLTPRIAAARDVGGMEGVFPGNGQASGG